jgi:hypothetical protein
MRMPQTTVKPRNPVERRSGSTELLIRITAIEVSQKYMTQMLEDQGSRTCAQRGCTLNDEVILMRSHMRAIKWIGGTAVVTLIGSLVRYCWPVVTKLFVST